VDVSFMPNFEIPRLQHIITITNITIDVQANYF